MSAQSSSICLVFLGTYQPTFENHTRGRVSTSENKFVSLSALHQLRITLHFPCVAVYHSFNNVSPWKQILASRSASSTRLTCCLFSARFRPTRCPQHNNLSSHVIRVLSSIQRVLNHYTVGSAESRQPQAAHRWTAPLRRSSECCQSGNEHERHELPRT